MRSTYRWFLSHAIRSDNNRFTKPGKRPRVLFYSAPGRKRATLHNLSLRAARRLLSESPTRVSSPAVRIWGASEFKFLRPGIIKPNLTLIKLRALCICARFCPRLILCEKRRNGFTSCLSNLFIREKPFKFAIKSVAAVMRGRVERKSAKRKPPTVLCSTV